MAGALGLLDEHSLGGGFGRALLALDGAQRLLDERKAPRRGRLFEVREGWSVFSCGVLPAQALQAIGRTCERVHWIPAKARFLAWTARGGRGLFQGSRSDCQERGESVLAQAQRAANEVRAVAARHQGMESRQLDSVPLRLSVRARSAYAIAAQGASLRTGDHDETIAFGESKTSHERFERSLAHGEVGFGGRGEHQVDEEFWREFAETTLRSLEQSFPTPAQVMRGMGPSHLRWHGAWFRVDWLSRQRRVSVFPRVFEEKGLQRGCARPSAEASGTHPLARPGGTRSERSPSRHRPTRPGEPAHPPVIKRRSSSLLSSAAACPPESTWSASSRLLACSATSFSSMVSLATSR